MGLGGGSVGALLEWVALSRRFFGLLLAGTLCCGTAATLAQVPASEGPLEAARWLAPGSDFASALTVRPRRSDRDPALPASALLGELAFQSPAILGRAARLSGLSCDTCHPNGHANARFFVAGVSDRPGNVDPINPVFNPAGDDGVFQVVNIPSLRGVAETAPYGRDGRFGSLADFVRHVIVDEFAGDEPPDWLMSSLLAYLQTLEFLPPEAESDLDPTIAATGERVFKRLCADCHKPATAYSDGRRHDVGTGGAFVTPTLHNIGDSGPYLHDGRFAQLADVVRYFVSHQDADLSLQEHDALIAYVASIGSTADADVAISLADDIDRLISFLPALELALTAGEGAQAEFVVRELRRQAGLIHERFPDVPDLANARQTLAVWSRNLQAIGEAGDGSVAVARLDRLRQRMVSERDSLVAVEPFTLYRPDNFNDAVIQEAPGHVSPGRAATD